MVELVKERKTEEGGFDDFQHHEEGQDHPAQEYHQKPNHQHCPATHL
jgi:hypothetical protein